MKCLDDIKNSGHSKCPTCRSVIEAGWSAPDNKTVLDLIDLSLEVKRKGTCAKEEGRSFKEKAEGLVELTGKPYLRYVSMVGTATEAVTFGHVNPPR